MPGNFDSSRFHEISLPVANCRLCSSYALKTLRAESPFLSIFCFLAIPPNAHTMAAPMDQRIAVPVDDPNADTEW